MFALEYSCLILWGRNCFSFEAKPPFEKPSTLVTPPPSSQSKINIYYLHCFCFFFFSHNAPMDFLWCSPPVPIIPRPSVSLNAWRNERVLLILEATASGTLETLCTSFRWMVGMSYIWSPFFFLHVNPSHSVPELHYDDELAVKVMIIAQIHLITRQQMLF